MKFSPQRFLLGAALAFLSSSSAIGGCSCSADIVGGGGDGSATRDLAQGAPPDLVGVDLTPPPPNACGDQDPSCTETKYGPPNKQFPLQSDNPPDPNEADTGVDRDSNGFLVLSSSKANFDYVWAAHYYDWNMGTVSKLSSKKVTEVARYATVTCFSNPTGSRAMCDGTNGCCSRDDYYNFTARQNNGQPMPHQAIQLLNNHPSRTAVDFNGDVWVSNRAFSGQSSVSKIANDPKDCIDRNKSGSIETSSDTNGDGVIDTDCNQNGVPDDIADVKAKPCTNGKPQEFYSYDDECILFTTNTNVPVSIGRPFALGKGAQQFGPSDGWAGSFNDGKFFRIDGTTGVTKSVAQVGSGVYGAAVDKDGILWTPVVGDPHLYYFNTTNPQQTGTARLSTIPTDAYGITMDRDQNVWLGGYPSGNASRYSPDRTNGFANLGMGSWTVIKNPGGAGNIGRGIAADNRTQGMFWVWMGRHPNFIVRIPGNLAIPKFGTDAAIDGSGFGKVVVAGGSPAGAGVDTDQNVWAIASDNSVATRIKVDVNGNMTPPDIAGGVNNQGCPSGAGDRCTLRYQHPNGGTLNPDPVPYTYSDFTGFGLRNFTNPQGSWSYVQKGCGQFETHWYKINFDADVPANTTVTVRARSGPTPTPDQSWGAWTGSYTMSPADLAKAPGPLLPNPNSYLQVEFDLASQDRATTPHLKSFGIVYECGTKIM